MLQGTGVLGTTLLTASPGAASGAPQPARGPADRKTWAVLQMVSWVLEWGWVPRLLPKLDGEGRVVRQGWPGCPRPGLWRSRLWLGG